MADRAGGGARDGFGGAIFSEREAIAVDAAEEDDFDEDGFVWPEEGAEGLGRDVSGGVVYEAGVGAGVDLEADGFVCQTGVIEVVSEAAGVDAVALAVEKAARDYSATSFLFYEYCVRHARCVRAWTFPIIE